MNRTDIDAQLAALGARPQHRSRVLRHWLQAIPLTRGRKALDQFLPKALFEALPGLMADWQALAVLHTREPSQDGSERLLLRLPMPPALGGLLVAVLAFALSGLWR